MLAKIVACSVYEIY